MPEIPQTNKVPSHPIVVHCPSFEENSGGAIVLHYLVDRLRAYGVEAYAWPLVKHNNHDADIKQYGANIPGWWRKLRILNQKRRRIRKEKRAEYNFVTHPSMNVPVASESLLRRSIAVYPEVVSGNPLGAPYIVRWLLHRPDFFGAGLDLDLNEIVFYYQKAFKEGVPWVDPDNMLCIRWIRDDVYYDRKLGGRSGSCRMIRKGRKTGAAEIPQGDDAILLDKKSHSEIASVFNATERFYCHDPYTMYTLYAAVCGCIPIVLPQPGLSIEDWRPLEGRWGVAYGDDAEQIRWALETRHKLLETLDKGRAKDEESVRGFVHKLALRFG